MKLSRTLALILAAILIGLCCTGCAKDPWTPAAQTPAPGTEPAATEAPQQSTDAPVTDVPGTAVPAGIPVRMRNGALSFLPEEPMSIPKLSEMVYTRPDADALIRDIEALTDKVPGCTDAQALLDEYYGVAPRIRSFGSMYDLALFRYSMDTSDGYYAEEYDYCDEQGTLVDEKENALYAAFAASPLRDELEQACFGEGFFADYDDFNAGDETYFDLKKQENDLLFRYYDLVNSINPYNYTQVEQQHEATGGLFTEIVKVRQRIAAAKGYDNYMDYSYACIYGRDYTTAEAREYLSMVRELFAPLMENTKIAGTYSTYSDWSESKAIRMLSSAAERMSGPVWEAFRFMSAYELYDVSYAANKLSTGYTSYLADYEAPFIFVDPDTKDLLTTLFHEFGHFTDWYRNYGVAGDYETGETYSQVMQYLAFEYADGFSDKAREQNLRATLSDLLIYSILREGACGDFELQVYQLAPEELTVERIDAVYEQCMRDYGLSGLRNVEFKGKFWSVYNHFFAYPGYVISYSVSAISAMQLCRLEAEEPGAGVDAFCRLLDRTHGKKFVAVLDEAGLDDPFSAEAMEKTAAFLRQAFDPN